MNSYLEEDWLCLKTSPYHCDNTEILPKIKHTPSFSPTTDSLTMENEPATLLKSVQESHSASAVTERDVPQLVADGEQRTQVPEFKSHRIETPKGRQKECTEQGSVPRRCPWTGKSFCRVRIQP